MNLYEIMFVHYAPKGSEEGILTYLVANSDEDVYEWLKKDIKLKDGRNYYTPYGYKEEEEEEFDVYDDNYNIIGTESYKEKIIRLNGDMFDEDEEFNDLYYGKTLTGWKLIKEDISEEKIELISYCGIAIEMA